jgi:hypothetical protein
MALVAAFYDANVLYPAELRNFLMPLAMTGLFRAKWSAEVHEEWIGNLLINRPDLSLVQLFWQNWQLSTLQGLCDSSSMTMPCAR